MEIQGHQNFENSNQQNTHKNAKQPAPTTKVVSSNLVPTDKRCYNEKNYHTPKNSDRLFASNTSREGRLLLDRTSSRLICVDPLAQNQHLT
ncbi:hypothetical protein CEXT_606671 [Caerostris extrusa]|uniref:Uncharacterized protein n=1 Tax=Caerostris extrusa TaxID=172846 RepID=A0AAV4NS49_CAEEX|nr:hypothetical protein CEXT_606671 [Caerostris extrusa]